MNERDVLKALEEILRDLLFDSSISLSMTTVRTDVPNWDSFTYVNFIVGVELRFGVKFGVAEVESFENVGEIVYRVLELMPE